LELTNKDLVLSDRENVDDTSFPSFFTEKVGSLPMSPADDESDSILIPIENRSKRWNHEEYIKDFPLKIPAKASVPSKTKKATGSK
jgi:hypothetical protein